MTLFRHGLLALLAVAAFCAPLLGAEKLHPAPTRHFNDYSNTVTPATAQKLDRRLADFERETSNQLLVVIYPRMETDSSVEDYTVRLAQKWGVGQKQRSNGAVLFVFKAERQLYISVGYGLEGALPDATAHRIIENELKPAFRAGNFDAGLTRAVDAMMAATRGEYRGTGRTANDRSRRGSTPPAPFIFFILLMLFFGLKARRSRGQVFGSPRHWVGGGGWHGSGGSWGGGSGGGFSGGGFSGGGGSFGGGGAGGRW